MKLSLLDIVQDILSDMNSDEVNSIQDTLESMQVAQIVKSVYFEMMGNKHWPHLRNFTRMQASGDSTKPTHMKIPDDVKQLEWFQYNRRTVGSPNVAKFEDIEYVDVDDFIRITNQYDSTASNVTTITDFSNITFSIKTDEHPKYWTSFDDEYIVCNAYYSALESTLQQPSTRVLAYIEPTWSMQDTAVPDLPSEAFPALLAEAKSTCFARIKQMPDQKAEQQAIRQKNWLSRKAWKAHGGIQLPSYARRSRK
jgi:hypothetical protein